MKIFEITEAKVEMCPEACCGKPVTECKCGPDCKHCDCHAKNKMNEASTTPPMKKELENLIRNVMSPEDGKKAFYAWIGLNDKKNGGQDRWQYGKTLEALVQKYNGSNASVSETASAGGTSAGAVAAVANPKAANTKQKKNKDGTAKNALELGNNLMGGVAVKR